jgi:hypothetical protein
MIAPMIANNAGRRTVFLYRMKFIVAYTQSSSTAAIVYQLELSYEQGSFSMSLLVHLTAEKNVAAIRRSGIKPGRWFGKIFAMPMLQNFFVTHQWLRELRRRGQRSYCGIYFRVPDNEIVWFGHYNSDHVEISAAAAVGIIMKAKDPLGMQIVVERRIAVKEIVKIRPLSQVIGWRYFPRAHGKELCLCPCCIRRGQAFSSKLREAWEHRARTTIKDASLSEPEAP